MQTVKNGISKNSDSVKDEVRRKRLGQFFTGDRLARLLFSLADAPKGASVIDPMCGTGDMLKAARYIDPTTTLSGVEIDDLVLSRAKRELKDARLSAGSAFNPDVWNRTGHNSFDLVITNPPYVRYQNLNTFDDELDIPDAEQVRKGLLQIVDLLVKDEVDKKLFSQLVDEYSGLSDLAVPSWILSAMLTKPGGTLALVVPESWLSRDYAGIIHYMISRWFRVRYVVEDTNAYWFPDALVKTTLFIADRVERKDSAFGATDDQYVHVRITSAASSPESLVGMLYPQTAIPEKTFTKDLAAIATHRESQVEQVWSAHTAQSRYLSGELLRTMSQEAWASRLEPEHKTDVNANSARLPVELAEWLNRDVALHSLESEGVNVGQGLRTGANIFFYSDCIKESGKSTTIAPNPALQLDHLKIDSGNLGTVLRKQNELPDGYQIKKRSLKGRVLLLKNGRLSTALKKLIDRGARLTVNGVSIPNLSAVRTNTTWYLLPSLTRRHIPDLLIPRVNGNAPRTYLNSPGVIVDANFSTLWTDKTSLWDKNALVAFLNSSWALGYMELIGAVMGGGALKLEATHLRKLPVPTFSAEQISELSALGKELATTSDSRILERIDLLVAKVLLGKVTEAKLAELQAIAQKRIGERRHRS